MFSIALIGGDGAGKTTIARMLQEQYPGPVKYLYMGINVESSNVALPSSRLIEFLKKSKKNGKNNGNKSHSLHDRANHKAKGKIWSTARLLNRLAEEWYRQFLSRWYRGKGFIVVYDRHFLFDFVSNGVISNSELPMAERIHRWCLNRFYPNPDLTIFLDAPAEVLYARKGEASISYLNSRRREFLQKGEATPNFVRIDATNPLNEVYQKVAERISSLNECLHQEKNVLSIN